MLGRNYIRHLGSPTMRLPTNQLRVAAALRGVRGFGATPSVDPLAVLEQAYQESQAPNGITDWQHVPSPVSASPTHPYSISVIAMQCALNNSDVRDARGNALVMDGQWGPNTSYVLGRFLGREYGAAALTWAVSADHRSVAFRSRVQVDALRALCPEGGIQTHAPTPSPVTDAPPALVQTPEKSSWTTWLLGGAAAVAVGTIGWVVFKKKRRTR